MRIISSGDWHVNLHKKKVPYDWQFNRYKELFSKLLELEKTCDAHVVSGDLFDKEPETDDVCLLLSYLNSVTIPTIVIPGNHEATKKGATFWDHFLFDNSIANPLVHIFTKNDRIKIGDASFCLFPYGSVQTNNLPEHHDEDILVTHIRGEVPPHITAEFDFERIRPWKLTLISDLHFNHKYKNFNVYYPGSPVNTTFDRDNKRKYGVDIINFNSIDDYTVEFFDLDLPKLIRKTITAGSEMISDPRNHVIYEVTGSIDQIAKIEKSELLDKKIVEKETGNSTLDLKNKKTVEELEIYLQYLKVEDVNSILDEYKALGVIEE